MLKVFKRQVPYYRRKWQQSDMHVINPTCIIRNASTNTKKQKKPASEKLIRITSLPPQTSEHLFFIESLSTSDCPVVTLYTYYNCRFLLS